MFQTGFSLAIWLLGILSACYKFSVFLDESSAGLSFSHV
jgi:hypothetical protein